MNDKRSLTGAAAVVACVLAAGCVAVPPPPPEVTVYHPPRDPRYEVPERLRAPRPPVRREQWAGFQQQADRVHRLVQADPAFGGFILRWQPEAHAIVMFTGDAEARLRRYTSDPRFKAMRVDITLAELERLKDRTSEQLARLRLQCWSADADEEHNSVTVGAPPAELAKLRAAIAAGQFTPPPKFRMVTGACATLR